MKEKKKKKQKKNVKLMTLLFVLTLIVGALLVAALIFTGNDVINDSTSFVYSETLYIILIFAGILPIILIVMVIDLIRKRKLENENFNKLNQILENEDSKIDLNKINNKNIIKDRSKKTKALIASTGVDKLNIPTEGKSESSVSTETNKELSEKEILENGESRFYMLTKIDMEAENYVSPEYNNTMSLEDICKSFRKFSSCRLGLYYDIKDIRRFIAGLSVTKLLILQGMSGTGKTSLAYAFGEYLNNSTVIIPIQPMWKERSDLIGYYNEFTKKFNETMLLQKLYEANYNDEIYIVVLDELNIARIEYYFAEFLSLLEIPNYDKRNLDVVADEWKNDPKLLNNGQLRLPKNMWFIGTANNDDSTFAISDKVYDRAMVLNLDKKAKPFEVLEADGIKLSASRLDELFTKAQKKYRISRRNLNRIRQLDKYLIDNFHLTFGNRIMKQIRSYVPVVVACGGTELDALDDVLSKKVLRKLEAKNPVYVRSASAGLISFIDDLFGEDKMPQCKEYIQTIEQNS